VHTFRFISLDGADMIVVYVCYYVYKYRCHCIIVGLASLLLQYSNALMTSHNKTVPFEKSLPIRFEGMGVWSWGETGDGARVGRWAPRSVSDYRALHSCGEYNPNAIQLVP
jgi:hypothetical protein